MGIYFTRYCPNCKFTLEYFKRSCTAVRSPYLDCPACGAKIRLDNLREWDDLNSFGKTWHIFTHVCMSFLYSLILIVVAFCIAVRLLDIDSSEVGPRTSLYVVVAAIVGAGILSAFRAIWFLKRIKESLVRTRKRGTDQDLSAPVTVVRMGSEID